MKILFCILTLVILFNGHSQIKVDVSFSSSSHIENGNSFESKGSNKWEFINVSLADIFKKSQDYHIKLDDPLNNLRLDISVIGDSLNESVLTEALVNKIMNVDTLITEAKTTTNEGYSLDFSQVSESNECEIAGINNITKINRYWKGICVSKDKIKDQLEEYYQMKFKLSNNSLKRHFDIDIFHQALQDEIQRLEEEYNLIITNFSYKKEIVHVQVH